MNENFEIKRFQAQKIRPEICVRMDIYIVRYYIQDPTMLNIEYNTNIQICHDSDDIKF